MPSPDFYRTFLAWDSEAIFAAAGGTMKLIQLLDDNNFPLPKVETASMWKTRSRIPHAWIPMCVYAILKAERTKLSSLFRTIHASGPPDDESEDKVIRRKTHPGPRGPAVFRR